MMNDTPEAALRSRIADLEQQLRLADEGTSRLAQRCLELEKQLQRYEEKAMSDKDAANVAAVLLTAAANAAALAPKEQADSGQSTPAVLMEAKDDAEQQEVVLDGTAGD